MTKKRILFLCMGLLTCSLIALAVYVKANEKELIKANIQTIMRTFNMLGIYPVTTYKDGRGEMTFNYEKPVFNHKKRNKVPRNSAHHKAPGYISYNLLHKEGVNGKCEKTYNDSFNMTCTLGNKEYTPLSPDMLGPESPVLIIFNGFTLQSTLGEGDKFKNLDDPEKGGMSSYKVPDEGSSMNLNVQIRWNKKGSAVCTFKATPFKDLAKTDPKFQLVTPNQDQKPHPAKEGEQWFYNSDPTQPVIYILLGYMDGTSDSWKWQGLAYNGTDKEKTSKGVDTESYTAKGKTAYWGL